MDPACRMVMLANESVQFDKNGKLLVPTLREFGPEVIFGDDPLLTDRKQKSNFPE